MSPLNLHDALAQVYSLFRTEREFFYTLTVGFENSPENIRNSYFLILPYRVILNVLNFWLLS